jgi:hypothetical protein
MSWHSLLVSNALEVAPWNVIWPCLCRQGAPKQDPPGHMHEMSIALNVTRIWTGAQLFLACPLSIMTRIKISGTTLLLDVHARGIRASVDWSVQARACYRSCTALLANTLDCYKQTPREALRLPPSPTASCSAVAHGHQAPLCMITYSQAVAKAQGETYGKKIPKAVGCAVAPQTQLLLTSNSISPVRNPSARRAEAPAIPGQRPCEPRASRSTC